MKRKSTKQYILTKAASFIVGYDIEAEMRRLEVTSNLVNARHRAHVSSIDKSLVSLSNSISSLTEMLSYHIPKAYPANISEINLEALKQEMAEVDASNAYLTEALKKATDKLEKVILDKKQVDTEVGRLKIECEARAEEILKLKIDREQLACDVSNIRNQASNEKKKLEGKILDTKAEKDNLARKLDKANKELEIAYEKEKRLNGEFNETLNNLKKAQKEQARLKDREKQLENRLIQLEAAMTSDNIAVATKNLELSQALELEKSKSADLEKKLADAANEIKDNSDKIVTMKAREVTLEREIAELKEETQLYHKTDSTVIVLKLRQNIEKLKEENSRLTERNQELENENIKLDQYNKVLRCGIDTKLP